MAKTYEEATSYEKYKSALEKKAADRAGDKDSKWKDVVELGLNTLGSSPMPKRTEEEKAKIEAMQLKNERARNPKEFDAAKAMYESATSRKKGGSIKCMAKGGSASSRADGIAVRGKTRGTIC